MGSNEVLVITGMSGAGKSTVSHALEDLGWYVVDNLPPAMIANLCEMASQNTNAIAVVIDVRGGEFFDDLTKSLSDLAERNINRRILFVDASDESLVRRFESTRRPHPLQGPDRILDGITKERIQLQEVRSAADYVIDSSALNIHQLEAKIDQIFSTASDLDLRVNILSFGYKYGIPVDSDLVLDCRFIPNPHWIPELRPLTGLTPQVSEKVLGSEGVRDFVHGYVRLVHSMMDGYMREGKKYVTIAVGCTGGKHRSVAITEEIARQLSSIGNELSAHPTHRDVGRE